MMKKIVLLITTSHFNEQRIHNQILNLEKHKESLQKLNIEPYFVCAQPAANVPSPYKSINLDFEEQYFYLAKKTVLSLEHVLQHIAFDFVIKMDDDTLFNVNLFDFSFLNYDYIGAMDNVTKSKITLDLPPYRLKEDINLYPSIYNNIEFKFARGNFYMLSKRVVSHVVSNKHLLDKLYTEDVRVSEDQFVGYCVSLKDFSRLDIKSDNANHEIKALQITKNNTSLHPIPVFSFPSMIDKSPTEQISILENSAFGTIYRENKIHGLKKELHKVIMDFINSKRLMGIG